MLGTFGLPFMARLSVGASWASPSSDQKRRVAQAYGRYTTAVYATRFEFLGEQKIKRGTVVKSRMAKANGEPVSINFVLHDNDIAWQIRDVYLDSAISELATRRSEFTSVLRRDGAQGLLDLLARRIAELKTS